MGQRRAGNGYRAFGALGLLLALVLAGGVYAQGEGVIEGQVVNGTADGPTVGAGITVTLYAYQNDVETDSWETTTDAEGRFRFAGLDTDPTVSYQPKAVYLGVTYGLVTPLSFRHDQTALETTIQVYETTEDDSAITLDTVHIIAESFGEALRLSEIHLFGNSGDRTYIGRSEDGGRPVTVQIPLPQGAEGLSYHQGTAEGRFIEEPDQLLDTEPVPPGSESSLAFFSYHLLAEGGAISLERYFAYPVGKVNLLVAQPGLQIQSEQLVVEGQENFQGRQYAFYSAHDLAPDTPLVMELIPTGETPMGDNPMLPPGHPTADAPLQNTQGTLRWLGLALAGLVLVGGVVYATTSHGPAESLAPPLETDPEARRLLVKLADLEDAYEDGQVDDAEYTRRRSALYDEIQSLQP